MTELPALPPEPSSFRLALTLTVAGLLSGLGIVSVYELTLPAIEQNRRDRLRRSVFEVVPGSTKMQKLVWQSEALVVPGDAADDTEEAIYAAYDDSGAFLGYAIPGEAAGFQDIIKLIYGYEPVQQHIVGMGILESRETPGLGDKIYKDDAFQANFRALSVLPEIVLVPKGEREGANEVDGITGATISSKAVVRILNETNATWLSRLPAPGSEPKLAPQGEGGDR